MMEREWLWFESFILGETREKRSRNYHSKRWLEFHETYPNDLCRKVVRTRQWNRSWDEILSRKNHIDLASTSQVKHDYTDTFSIEFSIFSISFSSYCVLMIIFRERYNAI